MEKWFNVGKIVNTHGVRGEVRVLSITDFPEERYQVGNTLYLFREKGKEPLPLIIKSHRTHKNFDLLSFEQYEDLTAVEKFKGALLKVPESQLGELSDGEYYLYEIIGCDVFTTKGKEVGVVTEILTPGANDVWVVKDKSGKKLYIPYIDPVVKRVNVADKIILIEPMDGLLS